MSASDPHKAHLDETGEFATASALKAGGFDLRPTALRIAAPGSGTAKGIGSVHLDALLAGAGYRQLEPLDWTKVDSRLAMVIAADLLMVDLRGASAMPGALERLLRPVLAWPAIGEANLLVVVDLAGLDDADTALSGTDVILLCEPDAADVAVALADVAMKQRQGGRLHDIGRDGERAGLELLSHEVRRLAATIDRLAYGDGAEDADPFRRNGSPSDAVERNHGAHAASGHRAIGDAQSGGIVWRDSGVDAARAPVVTSSEIRALLQARRLRGRYLPDDLFADPAWDMMLDLMAARLDGKRVSVSSLCIAAAVPPTTALRWIGQLTARGLFVRSNDPEDARRVFIALSDQAAENIAAWFAATRRGGLQFSTHAIG